MIKTQYIMDLSNNEINIRIKDKYLEKLQGSNCGADLLLNGSWAIDGADFIADFTLLKEIMGEYLCNIIDKMLIEGQIKYIILRNERNYNNYLLTYGSNSIV